VLKTQDKYIKFALLTGVTKFGKVSVFSDLNNLNDISMDERYAALSGMIGDEIYHYFEDDIHQLASVRGLTYEEACDRLKELYDGYHFKLEGTAEEAISRIEEKHYARLFEADTRQLFKIGINFDNKSGL